MGRLQGAAGRLAAGTGRVGDALDLKVRRASSPPPPQSTFHPPHHRPPACGSAVRTRRAGTGAEWRGAERRAGRREAVVPGGLGLEGLRSANFEFCRGLRDEHLRLLPPSLLHLNLNACQALSHEALADALSRLPHLKALQLYWNLNVGDATLAALAAGRRPDLEKLNISGCNRVTDVGLLAVVASCPNLRDLDLTRLRQVTDDALSGAILALPRLERVNLYACPQLSDRSYVFFSALQKLNFLDLCGAENLSDGGLQAIAECKHLEYLNLSWCVKVTDEGVVPLARGCQFLTLLSVHGNLKITRLSLAALAKNCRILQTLDLQGCAAIPAEERSDAKLKDTFPSLTCTQYHS